MRGNDWKALLVLLLVSAGMIAAAPATAAKAKRSKEHMPLPGKTYSWSFEADTLGQKPAHTMAFGGTWQVIEDSTALAAIDSAAVLADSVAPAPPPRPKAPRFLHQSETDDGVAYHYINFTRPTLADLDASVRFRIRGGEIDPSAGLLFQMDPKGTSGYLVRVISGDSEIGFHYLLYGKRRDVKFAPIPTPEPGSWHTLGITRRRTVLTVLYDGKEVMTVRDDRYRRGTVGVWTEDDTLVDFAGLTATAR
jgi:hypothetical protein